MGGDPNYLLSGMILEVMPPCSPIFLVLVDGGCNVVVGRFSRVKLIVSQPRARSCFARLCPPKHHEKAGGLPSLVGA